MSIDEGRGEIVWDLIMIEHERVAPNRYVPGWDCHGLPIELKVLQSMSDEQRRELTPIKLRRKARDFALKTVKAQKEQFQRYPLPSVCSVWTAGMSIIPSIALAQLLHACENAAGHPMMILRTGAMSVNRPAPCL